MHEAWASLRKRWVLLLLLACLGAPSDARAQSAQETALARSLFEQGIEFADQGLWADAADRFRRAMELKPTPGVAFNLASALGEAGQVVEATELLEQIVRDPATTPELLAEAQAKLEQLGPRRGALTLHVEEPPGEQAQVEIDGKLWPRAAWSVAMPIDPGDHVVTGTVGTAEVAREPLQIAEGEQRTFTLRLVGPAAPEPVEAEPPAGPVEPKEPEHARKKPPLTKNWMLWTGVGAAVVAGALTAVLLSTGKTEQEKPITGNTGVLTW
jgi:hypothetical protein